MYVDLKRLNSYVEQIGSTISYDKVPIWKVGFSFSGPKVEGTQERRERQKTDTEKIDLLMEYLTSEDLVAEGRISDGNYFNHSHMFRSEVCKVTAVQIPPLVGSSEPRDTLLWVSESSGERHRLFLLKDAPRADDTSYAATSAYSTLLQLYDQGIRLSRQNDNDFIEQKRRKVLERELRRARVGEGHGQPDLDPESITSKVDAEISADSSLINPRDNELRKEFATNPVAALRRMGAQVGATQSVETLYRIRAVHMEAVPEQDEPSIVTFGYPIFMASAGPVL